MHTCIDLIAFHGVLCRSHPVSQNSATLSHVPCLLLRPFSFRYCTTDAWKSRIPAALASCALIASLLTNFWCETIVFTAQDGTAVSFGPWSRLGRIGLREECLGYPGGRFDGVWRTTRAFSVIAATIGALLCFLTWLSPCICNMVSSWRTLGFAYLAVAVLQSITLIFVASDKACSHLDNEYLLLSSFSSSGTVFTDNCRWDWGGYLNVVAIVLWVGAAVCMVSGIPKPMELPPPRVKTQTVTYTQTPQPDGSMVVTSEVVRGRHIPNGNL